jgi:hypothetical protein
VVLLPEMDEPIQTSRRSKKLVIASSQTISESQMSNAKHDPRSINDLKQQLEKSETLSSTLESRLQMIDDFENCQQISSEDFVNIQQVKNDLTQVLQSTKNDQKVLKALLMKLSQIESQVQTIKDAISMIEGQQLSNADKSFDSDEIQEKWTDQIVSFVKYFVFVS